MDDRLTFEEETHTYRLDGVVVPSVTQVLDGLLTDYSKVPKHILEHAQQRGTAVHKATELYLQDDLDEASLDPEVAPYFYQFVKWYKQSGFKVEHSELLVYSEKYRYAGALDLFGKLAKSNALIDLKTSRALMPSTGPQLSAYWEAFKERTKTKLKPKRFGLHLQPDRYELVPMNDTGDFSMFLSCLAIQKWRKKHG